MVADADLPVWSIKPNWTNGITERLSWLTDVLASSYGTEQRRAMRLSPRREFEMTFNPVDQDRSYFDLWLHRMGSFEFMVPLFHDSAKLTAAIAIGATTIPIDTRYREFVSGDLAIIIGDDPFTFDKVTVTAVNPDDISVSAGGVTQAWQKSARIHPLRRSRISDESLLAAITNHVGEATLQFQLNQANDIPNEGVWDSMYLGYPIIETPPNRRENLDLTFNRNSLVLDNEQGLRALADDAGRAFTVQVDNRMMVGRAEHWAFRQMLYRLRGQQSSIWMPTFNRDIELSRAALAANAYLNVKKIGYAYTGGAIDGRQHLMLPGGLVTKITGTGAAPSVKEEHLTLTAAIGADLPAGTFASFMDTCRLASDDIEIHHHTDTDGAAECNIGFRSFRDPRTVPDPIDYPIPTTATVFATCGEPAAEESSCVDLDTGFFAELIFDTTGGPLHAVIPTDAGIPHLFPWSWGFSLWRGGVMIADSSMLSADNYSDYDGPEAVTNFCKGWVTRYYLPAAAVPRGEAGFGSDPFGGVAPDTIKLNIQWPYNDWAFPDGQALMSVGFRLANDVLIQGTSTVTTGAGAPYLGTPWARQEGLWPLYFEWSFP